MTDLVITGTRHGRHDVESSLEEWAAIFGVPGTIIIGGDRNGDERSSRGVDLQALEHAKLLGWNGRVIYADWDRLGDRAGPERNGRMVRAVPAGAHLLAFPGPHSTGTYNCLMQGVEYGHLCVEVDVDVDWIEKLLEMEAKTRWVKSYLCFQ